MQIQFEDIIAGKNEIQLWSTLDYKICNSF